MPSANRPVQKHVNEDKIHRSAGRPQPNNAAHMKIFSAILLPLWVSENHLIAEHVFIDICRNQEQSGCDFIKVSLHFTDHAPFDYDRLSAKMYAYFSVVGHFLEAIFVHVYVPFEGYELVHG